MKNLFDYFFNYEHFYRIVILTLLLMFTILFNGCDNVKVSPTATNVTKDGGIIMESNGIGTHLYFL